MAGCAAPRSLSGPATGRVRRLGIREEAPRSLRYFCPMTLHPQPTGEPCLGEEVGPPSGRGEQAGRSPPPALQLQLHTWAANGKQGMGCSGTHVSCGSRAAPKRGENPLQRASSLAPLTSWDSQSAGPRDALQSHSVFQSVDGSRPAESRAAASEQGKGNGVSRAREGENT